MKRRLLIAEDNVGFSKVLKDSVEEAGWDAEVVDNGVDAVLRYIEGGIDIVLMDVVMPRMSGIDALRIMRKVDPNARVILFTGNPSDSTVKDAESLGAMDFLFKPFSTMALIEEINRNLKDNGIEN